MSEHLGWISWLMISTPWQEIKNSLFDGFCCTMTAAQIFDSMSHEHLCVGHTHEDVGLVLRSQVFKRFQYHIKMFDITASRFYSYPLMFAIAPSETLYLDWYPDWFVKETKICQGLTCVPICPTSFSPAISSHPDLPRDLHHKHASGSVHRIWYRHLVAATFLGSKDVQSFCQLIGRKSHCCSAKQNQVCCNSLVVKSRFLNNKLKEHFRKKNLFFQATYVNVVRDWTGNMVNYATTGGAYRKCDAKKDDRQIPHSFTFVRRDCR